MNKINGLLTQKPTSPVPRCGEKHRYSLTERVSKTGKPWTKVKAEGEGYGELYEVLSVEKTDFVDAHGNVSFNIDLAAQDNGAAAPAQPDKDWPEARPQQASVATLPTVRSTSSNGSTSATVTLARCIDDAVSTLDSRLTALTEAATPDARLDAVLRVALSLFIQSHK